MLTQRAKLKVLFSICLGAASLAFLGFASSAGGVSAAYANQKEISSLTTDQEAGAQAMVGGYGFASFWYVSL